MDLGERSFGRKGWLTWLWLWRHASLLCWRGGPIYPPSPPAGCYAPVGRAARGRACHSAGAGHSCTRRIAHLCTCVCAPVHLWAASRGARFYCRYLLLAMRGRRRCLWRVEPGGADVRWNWQQSTVNSASAGLPVCQCGAAGRGAVREGLSLSLSRGERLPGGYSIMRLAGRRGGGRP